MSSTTARRTFSSSEATAIIILIILLRQTKYFFYLINEQFVLKKLNSITMPPISFRQVTTKIFFISSGKHINRIQKERPALLASLTPANLAP
jgi:hypothetical protein